MEFYEIEGEKFYFLKGKIYDSCFLEPDTATLRRVAPTIFREAFPSPEKIGRENLIDYIRAAKRCEQYSLGIQACLIGLQKYGDEDDFVNSMLPILTSMYRLTGQPKLAIETAEKYGAYGMMYASVPLLTSVAAAYCDLGDFLNAKKFADRAYARQGGSTGEQTELSLVYQRLRRLTGE